jgi:hypothetical protein
MLSFVCQKVNPDSSLFKDADDSAMSGSIRMLSRPLSVFQPGRIDKMAFVWVRQSRRGKPGWNVYHPTRRPETTF